MTWPDRISVFHKLQSRPDKTAESIILDVMILSENKQRPAARCIEDVVVYDYRASRKTTLPPFMLDQFQRTFELQEEAKARNGDKMSALLDQVRDLERDSWDRRDAQEDMGSATP
jgi:Thioesterase-like superfamily